MREDLELDLGWEGGEIECAGEKALGQAVDLTFCQYLKTNVID